MISISIAQGTLPSFDTQVNNPRLRNGFVNLENEIQLLPNILQKFLIQNSRAIFQSTFNNRLIVVTQNEVLYIENNGINKAGDITGTNNPIRLDENTQNEVTIVNGADAYVFQQRTNGFSVLSAAVNGFDIENPVDVAVLDTLTVVVGGTDKKWIVSEADNALNYDANEVIVTDNSLGNLTGVRELNNNLFIFGDSGVQRWVPSVERFEGDFPFSQDPTYRDDFGCVSTASLTAGNNELFYLSKEGQVRMMRVGGMPATITNDGIENLIVNLPTPTTSFGSYFYHKGYYLYSLSFPTASTENNFNLTYCAKSKKWSENQDMIIGYSGNNALLSDGVYELTSDFSNAYRELLVQTSYFKPNPKKMYNRTKLGSIFLDMTQGKGTNADTQVCFLQLSKDNVLFTNRVKRELSKIGDRLFQFRWFANFVNNGFCLRFTLELKQEVTIQKCDITLE